MIYLWVSGRCHIKAVFRLWRVICVFRLSEDAFFVCETKRKEVKKMKKIVSLILVSAMLLCIVPTAFAEGAGVAVDFAFYDGTIVMPKQEITVTDGIAEEYGYTLSEKDHSGKTVDGITVFDVIVAAHEEKYGDKFTAETADEYLAMSSGFITKIFGIATSTIGFAVNDATPHDDVYVEAYAGYTGYSCDTAVVEEGDYVSVFRYLSSYWDDIYPSFDKTEISVVEGKEAVVSLSGYSIVYYGCSKQDVIDGMTSPINGVDVYATTDFVNYELLGKTDENGEIALSFDKEGKVWLCAYGNHEDETLGDIPVIANWCEVSVEKDTGIYFPKGLDITVADENGVVSITFELRLFDIKGEFADKTETLVWELASDSFIGKIMKFIFGVFAG